MKKVLIVFNHPAPYKVRLFNELSKYFDLHVIFERDAAKDRNKDFYFEKNYKFAAHKIRGIKVGKENFISNGIVEHLQNNKYDLIVMNGYSTFAEMKAISYLKENNIPYAFYINGGRVPEKESYIKFKIKNYFISGAKSYFSPDLESNKYLLHYGAIKEQIFNYTYSTIYENEILKEKPDKAKAKKKRGVHFDKVFVSSGQLIRRKNYLKFVKIWSEMPRNYGLYLFGDGNQKNRIKRYILRNSVTNVSLKGFVQRDKMLDFYKACDAFIFPSKKDIYGHVINEALSQGLPVVSTKHVNSALHLIDDDVNGYLLNYFDKSTLLDTIIKLEKKDHFEKCVETAKNNTIESMVSLHIDMFQEAMKK